MCADWPGRGRLAAGETGMSWRVSPATWAQLVEARGPDDSGEWADPEAGIALGHRRLAIIDLSPGGRQPMVSAAGALVIAYNGEIYNFRELRAELESAGVSFRGESDTEVLLEACAAWGIERALGRCIGMFAIALWDRVSRRLHLARDRLGIKPLYWGRIAGGCLVFASQPKCFSAHPDWRPAVDRASFAEYLRHGYVNAPRCIYRDAFQVRPGHMVTLDARGEAREHCYWDAVAVARDGAGSRERPNDVEAVERLDGLLRYAVARRMVADVPLGAFLSGGIDSSTVVALMQSQSGRPVRTFSIGFSEKRFDEATHARAVARHLGTDHTEALRRARSRDRSRTDPVRAVRRALRRLLPVADPAGKRARSPPCHRGLVGRWGRRAVRRLQPPRTGAHAAASLHHVARVGEESIGGPADRAPAANLGSPVGAGAGAPSPPPARRQAPHARRGGVPRPFRRGLSAARSVRRRTLLQAGGGDSTPNSCPYRACLGDATLKWAGFRTISGLQWGNFPR